jgi:hypothetical protein
MHSLLQYLYQHLNLCISVQLFHYIFFFYLWMLHPVAHLSNLVSYDAVNRNKVSIRQLSLLFPSHSLHVSAPTGHPQVRYTIDVYKDYSYYNGSNKNLHEFLKFSTPPLMRFSSTSSSLIILDHPR